MKTRHKDNEESSDSLSETSLIQIQNELQKSSNEAITLDQIQSLSHLSQGKKSNFDMVGNNLFSAQLSDNHLKSPFQKVQQIVPQDVFQSPNLFSVPMKRSFKVSELLIGGTKSAFGKCTSAAQSVSSVKTSIKQEEKQKQNSPAPKEKRRGRKRIKDDQYFARAQQRIEEIKGILSTAKQQGLTVKERQALRNKVSAQHSRLRKKQESIFLRNIVQQKDDKMRQLIDVLDNVLSQEDFEKVYNKVSKKWDSFQQSPNPLSSSRSGRINKQEIKNSVLDNFLTKNQDLEQFKQNDEKEIEF